jgi:hypothetical protein
VFLISLLFAYEIIFHDYRLRKRNIFILLFISEYMFGILDYFFLKVTMQASWQYVLIVSLLKVAYGEFETSDIRSISSGLSFGRCGGYCQHSINATLNPGQLIASKQANYAQELYPPVQRQYPFSSNQWEQLVSLVNSKVFTQLDDTIGCPGCADGGIEWIQVDWTDGTKRVTFEYGRAIKGIENLIEKLRQMREEYATQL